jgi:catechol 2,3-dioxygenase-like lactoylglutathione lyase family enzyme
MSAHMRLNLIAIALLLSSVVSASNAFAQLRAAREAPIAYGHHHLNVTNIAEHKKFFVDSLGGVPVVIAKREIVKFPNALVFLREQKPTGGNRGTTVNHLGFAVPNLRQTLDKLKANGFRIVTREEAPPNLEVKGDVGNYPGRTIPLAYVLGADDLKVELVENKELKEPITANHLHFFGQQNEEMQAWYVKVFAAKAGAPGGLFPSANLPGTSLAFSPSTTPVVGTQGRVIDHIGFEIDNLPEFLKKVEAMGIKPVNVRPVPDLNVSIAFITDPWGTYIELTEGLDKIE